MPSNIGQTQNTQKTAPKKPNVKLDVRTMDRYYKISKAIAAVVHAADAVHGFVVEPARLTANYYWHKHAYIFDHLQEAKRGAKRDGEL